MTDSAMPFDAGDNPISSSSTADKSTTPGGSRAVKWKVVAKLPGLTPATIVANRLQVEGIPARAWQEGAGQALGLTVGLLGTGYVTVPEMYEQQALDLLEEDVDDFFEE